MENKETELKARREFLAKCGRFAAVTPPAMAFLLSTTASSEATGLSHGKKKKKGGKKKGKKGGSRRGR